MKTPDNQSKSEFNLKLSLKLSTVYVDNLVQRENFAAFGIAKPRLNSFYYGHYKNWIANKYNANMAWIEKRQEIRENLLMGFPWAKSILIVAENYFFNKDRENKKLKISRYAWGDDYHFVLEKKLKRVLENLKKYNREIIGKVYVDTGPILEKAYAVESGLGWMGKNSLVIIPEVGSFVFLGLLILNAEFDHEQKKVESKCGKCTNCLEACPTGALENPYVLNANKCISYFSIEKRGDFTKQESEWLQDWLYGCDICQEVCPWNKKWAKTTSDLSYYNRIKMLERSPSEWKALTEEEFGQLFKKNVFKRLRFERFRRNLLTNIKNLH